ALHLEREAAIGRRIDELAQPLDLDKLERFRTRGLTGERLGDYFRYRRLDGTVLEAFVSVAAVQIDGESYFVTSALDLTEERRLEQLAAQSERKFTALFETNPVAMAVTRGPERRVVEINDACLALFGLTREQAIGKRTDELSSEVDPGTIAAMRA